MKDSFLFTVSHEGSIIDFKYGQGVPVETERNPRIMLCALEAPETCGSLCDTREHFEDEACKTQIEDHDARKKGAGLIIVRPIMPPASDKVHQPQVHIPQ